MMGFPVARTADPYVRPNMIAGNRCLGGTLASPLKSAYTPSVSILILFAATSVAFASGSSSLGSDRAAQFGVTLKANERYDPWMGFTTEKTLTGDSKAIEALIGRAKAELVSGEGVDEVATTPEWTPSRDCERLAGRWILDQKTEIKFTPLNPNADGTFPEAAYDPKGNAILINSTLEYLRHPQNLRRKLIHESFHNVQQKLDLIRAPSDYHLYAHRERILAYLNNRFPDLKACVLPEVPEKIRGQVPDMVSGAGGLGGYSARRPLFPDLGKKIPLLPSDLKDFDNKRRSNP